MGVFLSKREREEKEKSKTKTAPKATAAAAAAAAEESKAPVPLTHYPQAQSTFKLPLIANENAFLGDVLTSQERDPQSPITCGLYRLEKGTPLVYEYTYHELKIILEGSFEISDQCGNKVSAKPGDVFYFPKGSVITFTTEDYGLAFFTGQRVKGTA